LPDPLQPQLDAITKRTRELVQPERLATTEQSMMVNLPYINGEPRLAPPTRIHLRCFPNWDDSLREHLFGLPPAPPNRTK
jgi:hypothetical protein